MLVFKYIEKQRKFERNGVALCFLKTRLPVVAPSVSSANRRIAREHARVSAHFARYCETKLCNTAQRYHKLCAKSGQTFQPIHASLRGNVSLSDDKVYCVVFEASVKLPDGTEFTSNAPDMRSAVDGFPLMFDVRGLRKEARRQLDVRARFDSTIKPRKLTRRLCSDRLAATEDGFEYFIAGGSVRLPKVEA